MVEGVLILRNSSRKLKMVVGNAILLNYAVPSENISERIKIKTENNFYLKVNVCIFRWNKNRPEKQSHRRPFIQRQVKKMRPPEWMPRLSQNYHRLIFSPIINPATL